MRDNYTDNCVVSYQLLELLTWLFEHERETLKRLVNRSIQRSQGFTTASAQKTDDELEQGLENFFMLLEAYLYDAQDEGALKKNLQRSLLPMLDQIDANVCDDALVTLSAEKTTAAMERNPHEDSKQLLCKELLKRWKPAKDLIKN